jgi:rhodanese-related sulfurtransferase
MQASIRSASVQELQLRVSAGEKPVIIDVRTPAEFAAVHVPGARNVPWGSAEIRTLAREHAGRAGTLFVICQSSDRSRQCCTELAAAGVPDVVLVEGGTSAWTAAGLPLERAAGAGRAISLERQVRMAAGALVLTGCALGLWVHPGFFGVAAFVGAGLTVSGITGFCGMGLLLARMPWNQR